jgi:hypothetical protein
MQLGSDSKTSISRRRISIGIYISRTHAPAPPLEPRDEIRSQFLRRLVPLMLAGVSGAFPSPAAALVDRQASRRGCIPPAPDMQGRHFSWAIPIPYWRRPVSRFTAPQGQAEGLHFRVVRFLLEPRVARAGPKCRATAGSLAAIAGESGQAAHILQSCCSPRLAEYSDLRQNNPEQAQAPFEAAPSTQWPLGRDEVTKARLRRVGFSCPVSLQQ